MFIQRCVKSGRRVPHNRNRSKPPKTALIRLPNLLLNFGGTRLSEIEDFAYPAIESLSLAPAILTRPCSPGLTQGVASTLLFGCGYAALGSTQARTTISGADKG